MQVRGFEIHKRFFLAIVIAANSPVQIKNVMFWQMGKC